MSGKLDRIHKLEAQIATLTAELDSISEKVPVCKYCGGVDLTDVGYDWRCGGCKRDTPRIKAKYIRMPK